MPLLPTLIAVKLEEGVGSGDYTGGLYPEVQTLTLSYTNFDRKGNPFVYVIDTYFLGNLILQKLNPGIFSRT